MASSKHTIKKLKDKTDNNVIEKTNIDNVPFRMVICAKTGLGKTNLLANLLLRPEFYLNDFHGDDIYIWSGSLSGDAKLKTVIEQKNIPEGNTFDGYNEDILKELYDVFVDEFNERTASKKRIYNKLIILDDLSYTKCLKDKNATYINKVFMNGRKFNISIIITSQKYTDISTSQRANFSSCILYNSANSQVEKFEMDTNHMKNKKSFFNMWHNHIKEKRDFIVVNHSNPIEDMYLNKDFIPIKYKDYEI